MSYNYKIGFYSHEESCYIELQHDKKFSQEELSEMIAEAVVDTIKKVKEDDKDKYRCYLHSFEDIFLCKEDFRDDNSPRCVEQYLIDKFCFKSIEYELFWSVFGWGSLFDKDNWESDRGEHLNKITDAVNKAGFTRKDDDYLKHDDEINNKSRHMEAMKDLENMRFF